MALRGHQRELFRNAAADLGSDHLEVRLAAIYVLKELASDVPELSEPAFEIVAAYVRGREDAYRIDEPAADVLPAFELLCMRIVPDADRP